MLAIKSDTRYLLKTKRVKYTTVWKKSIKIVKEIKLSFFTTFFLPNFFHSVLRNFIIFASHSWIPSCTILIFSLNFFYSLHHNFFSPKCYYFPSSMLLFPPPKFYHFPSSSSSSFWLFSLLLQKTYFIKLSITIVKKHFLVVWWFSTEQM